MKGSVRSVEENILHTRKGNIHYWMEIAGSDVPTIVFLPGLTADRHLFDKQVHFFLRRYNLIVWDAPGHGSSRPFRLDFSLSDAAKWLHEILRAEGIARPVLVGQSMGGYIAQMYMELFPDDVSGFVSIDSAPLQRSYMNALEIAMLRHTSFFYKLYGWNALKRTVSRNSAVTPYGKSLMLSMLNRYKKDEYVELVAFGYRILADAIEQNLPYRIPCPAVLLCGTKDKVGSVKRYNEAWARKTILTLHRIENAGHNANTDAPDVINGIIAEFIETMNEPKRELLF